MTNLKGITILLTHEKSEEMFFNALCGAGVLTSYGLSLKTKDGDYAQAKKMLKIEQICREDVWMQILRMGSTLTIIDEEDDDKEYTITIKEVHERVQNTDFYHLADAINEQGDATTDDVILQTVFLNEVIYG
jgi:hypothetical protein